MPQHPADNSKTRQIADLRNQVRKTRDNLRKAQLKCNCESLTHHLFNSRVFQKSRHVAFYYPVNNEAGSVDIIRQSLWRGKECFLPVIDPARQLISFVKTNTRTTLKKNRYGIPEPVSLHALPVNRLDIILVPLLAFDASGFRIGMGGGYYDRTLASTSRGRYHRTPRIIGLAHDIQKLSNIPTRPWDVPLDGVFTESGFRQFFRQFKQ